MFYEIEKTALVTHKGCLDGSVCAVLYLVSGGKKENIFFSNPSHSDTDTLVRDLSNTWEGPILLADISISSDLAQALNNFNREIIILDHHESAIPLSVFSWCEIEKNNTRCGSRILFDWLLKNDIGQRNKLIEYRELVFAADSYDRWTKENPQSDSVAAFQAILGQDLFVDRFIRNSNLKLTTQEQYLVEIEEKRKDIYIKSKKQNAVIVTRKIDERDVRIAYVTVNSPTIVNKLGEAIYNDSQMNIDVVVMVGVESISMRARKGCSINLSRVATSLGGGGHRLASGLPLKNVLNRELIDIVLEKLKFE